MNLFSDSLHRKILPDHSLKNMENMCLQKQNLKHESTKTEQIISTVLFMIFRDNLIPIGWKSVVPIKAMKNLEKSRSDIMKSLAQRETVLRESRIRSIRAMVELKRTQEMRVDKFSVHKLRESHATIQELTSQIQELQEKVYYMNDSREIQDVESNCSGKYLTFPVNRQSFQVFDLC